MEPIPAEVTEIIGRSGSKGVIQVKCKIITGSEKGRLLIRNVNGPIRVGDIIWLKEVEMESTSKIEEK